MLRALSAAKNPTPFRKGMTRAPTAGRRKGQPNRTTVVLKQAILIAAESVGQPTYNRKTKQWTVGKGGLHGYLVHLAITEPKSFTALLARVLPLQITGDGGGPLRIIDGGMSAQDASQAYADSLKAGMIDVTPVQPAIPRYIPGAE